ncbi:helix-turn-helix transcriptional regulator [Phycicoccus duodecadis]|uniref:Regulatory LuxR family protein n=1 Tax=Phycicoccus duodecadis TaxID=173053 RepID=A0A2N3YMU9_9MICO|nr:helix-turn-helix transcriptional regulator [Phycicoccus duodecadis]PKW28191.1 regulatory LuxR family protein [Phycicoccus duodecadis]
MSPGSTAATPGSQRDFFRWVHARLLAGDERFVRLGSVQESLTEGAEALAASVRRSLWHVTRVPHWQEARAARSLAALERRRDLDTRYVTDPRSLTRLPMLAGLHPQGRVAHVVGPLLLVDTRLVFVGAPHGDQQAGQVWRSTSPAVVGAAATCFEAMWAESAAVHEPGEEPTFTPRMVDIGFLLTDGATDAEIARELAVSARTVSAEVAEIVRRLGARNRSHAIALIGGGTH